MFIIAVIPARIGSKRIAEKVLQRVGHQTLLEHTIEVCQESEIFDEILISTDSEKVAKVAETKGISVPFLRTKFSDDFSTVSSATGHALETYQSINVDVKNGIVLQVMPTCPFLTSKTIKTFLEEYRSCNSNVSLLSCTKADPLVPFSFRLGDSGIPKYLDPNFDPMSRTQDLPETFLPSGAVWVSSVKKILDTRNFYSGIVRFRPLDFWEGFDIDTPEQLILAQHIAEIKGG